MSIKFYEDKYNNDKINEQILKTKIDLLRLLVKKTEAFNKITDNDIAIKKLILDDKNILSDIVKEENLLVYEGYEDIEKIKKMAIEFAECDISSDDFIIEIKRILQKAFDTGLICKEIG